MINLKRSVGNLWCGLRRQLDSMRPFFSIIIPVYNVAPYLRECLDSVLAQTFTNWEAICVDDGSTDGSGVILDEYAAKDKRFRGIHQKNGGVSAARNAALSVAQGAWVTFLDGDDKYLLDRLQHMCEIIQSHPEIDWVHETDYLSSLPNRNKDKQQAQPACEIISGKGMFEAAWEILLKNALMWLNTYRKSIVSAIKFPVGMRYAEDDVFELLAVPRCRSFVIVGGNKYWYREDRADAASRRIDVEDSVKVHQKIYEIVSAQSDIIDSLTDIERFKTVFTKTVWKDFTRVFRILHKAGSLVRADHFAITKKIRQLRYFNLNVIGNYAIGYYLYATYGWLLPIYINDYVVRAINKFNRIIGVKR